jgi:hypothetical protein
LQIWSGAMDSKVSANHTQQRTRPSCPICLRAPSCAWSLSLGR